MPTYLVTGCAGFIGSHLAERLVREGHQVVGIDCLADYYPRWMKEQNLEWLKRQPNFTFHEDNLLSCDLSKIVDSSTGRPVHQSTNKLIDQLTNQLIIFHLAAQPGVRTSWGENFGIYVQNNIRATQRLLEWAKDRDVKRFIYTSSSSVYGDTRDLPMREDSVLRPTSPYGVTKLAGEHLCYLYWKNFRVPTVVLRYFTAYGPRQRPDMAFYKFIKAMLRGEEVEIYGDGNQTRDFTYIDDIIDATLLAVDAPSNEVFNVGGGKRISVNETIEILEDLIGKKAKIKHIKSKKGDLRDTYADTRKIEVFFGYNPKTELEKGLQEQIEGLRS